LPGRSTDEYGGRSYTYTNSQVHERRTVPPAADAAGDETEPLSAGPSTTDAAAPIGSDSAEQRAPELALDRDARTSSSLNQISPETSTALPTPRHISVARSVRDSAPVRVATVTASADCPLLTSIAQHRPAPGPEETPPPAAAEEGRPLLQRVAEERDLTSLAESVSPPVRTICPTPASACTHTFWRVAVGSTLTYLEGLGVCRAEPNLRTCWLPLLESAVYP
jgi:hypothetical protein